MPNASPRTTFAGFASAPLRFLALTLGWTWAWWWGAVALGVSWTSPLATTMYVLGGLGPIGVAVALTASEGGAGATRRFLRASVDPTRAPARAWAAVAAVLAVSAVAPVAIEAVRRGVAPWSLVDPSAPLAFLVVGLLAGLIEEPGWRGYAQVGLQRRLSPLLASLVVGGVWAVWHLPLFFLGGTYQASLGVGTPAFWTFFAAVVVISPVYAWLLGTARGAPVAVVVYHGLSNAASELFGVEGAALAELATLAAIVIVLLLGPGRWMLRHKAATHRS